MPHFINQYRVAVFCIALLAIQSIVFCSLVCLWLSSKLQYHSPLESVACLPCEKLQFKSFNGTIVNEEAVELLRRRTNASVCCGPPTHIVGMVMEQVAAQVYYRYSISSSAVILKLLMDKCERYDYDANIPRGKLVGVVDTVVPESTLPHEGRKLLWYKNNKTFTANNMIHLELEGEIFIKKPGVYFVVSHLNINNTNASSLAEVKTFSHYLYKSSHKYGTVGILMQSMKTICERKSLALSSTISSVFKFDKYDRLSIVISHPEFIDKNDLSNFFAAVFSFD